MTGKAKDRTGQRFGRLTAIGRVGSDRHGFATWRCVCSCGTEIVARANGLASGNTLSCGCLKSDLLSERSTHGATAGGKTVEYRRWKAMKDRCYCESTGSYPWYGGKGIVVCDKWRDSFENFLEDMGPIPTPQHTVERHDSTKPYSPDNCCWATQQEQANNKTTTRWVRLNGQLVSTADAARSLGISRKQAARRLPQEGR